MWNISYLQTTNSIEDVIEVGIGIESTLFIPSVSVENGGLYVCTAEFSGTAVTAEAYINVTSGNEECSRSQDIVIDVL